MIKFFIPCFLLYFYIINPLIVYWNKKLNNNYFAELYFGIPGTGKTGLCTKFSVENQLNHKYDRVYCNFEIPGTYLYNINDIRYHKYKFMDNSLVLIDEAGVNMSNREFKNIDKDFLAWFAFLRHNKCRVKIFSQHTDIDKKVRNICECYHILRRWLVWTIDIPVYKNQDVGYDSDNNGSIIEDYKKGSIFEFKFHYLPRYIGLWDSYDYINVPLIPSRFILPDHRFKRAANYRKWYVFNWREVYNALRARVKRLRADIYDKHFRYDINLSSELFTRLQTMNM